MPNSSGGRSIVPLAASLGDLDRLAQDRLAVLDQVEEDRLDAAGQDQHADRLAAVVDRLVGADQVIPVERPAPSSSTCRRPVRPCSSSAWMVQLTMSVARGELERGNAELAGAQLAIEAARRSTGSGPAGRRAWW